MSAVLLALVAPQPGERPPPERLVLGRAALVLALEGLELRVGTAQAAWRAVPGAWVPADPFGAAAVYDRFPSWTWPEAYAQALSGLEALPRANPPALAALCRDKLHTQRVLEAAGLPLPPVEPDPARFAEALGRWGAGFLKPRYGALGRGVSRVQPGDALPAQVEGGVRGAVEPALLQQAVPPPPGLAALCLRALVQREVDGGWRCAPLVARVSAQDPVANVDRGAQAVPAEDLLDASTRAQVAEAALEAARVLTRDQPLAVELGVDLVLDPSGQPWILEVNGRPGGRLGALAREHGARFAEAELDAACAPLRSLARFIRG